MFQNEEQTLFERLSAYAASDAVPLHMPGHKRNPAGVPFLEALGAKYDITEIDGFDNLHDPPGILKDAMARAACLWGSDRCFFLVNGSTCGVLAAVTAAAKVSGRASIASRGHWRLILLAVSFLCIVFLLKHRPVFCHKERKR